MNKFKIILLIFIFFGIVNIFSLEKKEEKKHKIEFSLGLITSPGYQGLIINEFSSFLKSHTITSYPVFLFENRLYVNTSIFINDYYAPGFTTSIGNAILYYNNLLFGTNIIYDFKFSNKIGYNKNFFIQETGVKILCRYITEDEDVVYNSFYIGPIIFLGYEIKINKFFNITTGQTFSSLFSIEKDSYDSYAYLYTFQNLKNEKRAFLIETNIELRFAFYIN